MTISDLARRSDLVEAAHSSAAWPFEEARKLVERVKRTRQTQVLFETGYGPSGLPHIGTFGEVARTTMVRNAFRILTEDQIPTRLIAFSDDMDGMRKVPENVPQREHLEEHLHKPLTRVPDPFGEYQSFGHHNNAMLRRFLDTFGFDYEFASATDYYTSGKFDLILRRAAERYQAIMDIMLPTLGEERQATYSCFLPISPTTGRVLYVPMKHVDGTNGTVTFDDEDGREVTLPVTGGNVKLQWKPDFGARWAALGVDFEMYGKDHQPNTAVYDSICRALGGEPPEHFVYELFLDEKGQKISKSKGNGVSIDDWLTYASPESLALFMFSKPREAKKLYFDVIPKQVDEYLNFLERFPRQELKEQLGNPVFHIHNGEPPLAEILSDGEGHSTTVNFAMLLNLVAVANSEDKQVVWGFLKRYSSNVSADTHPTLDRLIGYALAYYRDFVRPGKVYHAPTAEERKALEDLSEALASLEGSTDGDALQSIVYEVGRSHFPDLSGKSKSPDGRPGVAQAWFSTLYRVLLGAERGPRFGSFTALYGVAETRALINRGLDGTLIADHAHFLANREGR
jgi:lysyl-tRNA synthetase, class I